MREASWEEGLQGSRHRLPSCHFTVTHQLPPAAAAWQTTNGCHTLHILHLNGNMLTLGDVSVQVQLDLIKGDASCFHSDLVGICGWTCML